MSKPIFVCDLDEALWRLESFESKNLSRGEASDTFKAVRTYTNLSTEEIMWEVYRINDIVNERVRRGEENPEFEDILNQFDSGSRDRIFELPSKTSEHMSVPDTDQSLVFETKKDRLNNLRLQFIRENATRVIVSDLQLQSAMIELANLRCTIDENEALVKAYDEALCRVLKYRVGPYTGDSQAKMALLSRFEKGFRRFQPAQTMLTYSANQEIVEHQPASDSIEITPIESGKLPTDLESKIKFLEVAVDGETLVENLCNAQAKYAEARTAFEKCRSENMERIKVAVPLGSYTETQSGESAVNFWHRKESTSDSEMHSFPQPLSWIRTEDRDRKNIGDKLSSEQFKRFLCKKLCGAIDDLKAAEPKYQTEKRGDEVHYWTRLAVTLDPTSGPSVAAVPIQFVWLLWLAASVLASAACQPWIASQVADYRIIFFLVACILSLISYRNKESCTFGFFVIMALLFNPIIPSWHLRSWRLMDGISAFILAIFPKSEKDWKRTKCQQIGDFYRGARDTLVFCLVFTAIVIYQTEIGAGQDYFSDGDLKSSLKAFRALASTPFIPLAEVLSRIDLAATSAYEGSDFRSAYQFEVTKLQLCKERAKNADYRTYIRLALASAKMHDNSLSSDWLEKAKSCNLGNGGYLLDEYRIRRYQGDLKGAINSLDSLLNLSPSSSRMTFRKLCELELENFCPIDSGTEGPSSKSQLEVIDWSNFDSFENSFALLEEPKPDEQILNSQAMLAKMYLFRCLAQLYQDIGEAVNAELYLNKALQAAQSNTEYETAIVCASKLADRYERAGKLQAALDLRKKIPEWQKLQTEEEEAAAVEQDNED